MPKEILGPKNKGFDHHKKLFISGTYNSCGAHCLAMVFSELLLSGALEKNYLLGAKPYRLLLQSYQEIYPENNVNSWNDLKQQLIRISKDNNIEIQEHLGVVIRKFSTKILFQKTGKFYKEFKHNIDAVLDSIILRTDLDNYRYLNDFGFDDVDDLRAWAGVDFVTMSPYSEQTYDTIFARYLERIADCDANVMYTEGILVEIAKNLAFATQIYGPNSMINTTSPINPIVMVKCWNGSGVHWEIQKVLTSSQKEQLRTSNTSNTILEEMIDDQNSQIAQLISLGYPKLLAEGVVKQFRYDDWLGYYHFLLEDPDRTNELLEQYNAELMQPIITKIDFNQYQNIQFEDQERLVTEYIILTSTYPNMLSQETLLILSAIKLNIDSNKYGQETLIAKLKNPAYYSEIKKTCQDVFNILPKEIQQEIYLDSNDYMPQYKMKSMESTSLLALFVSPERKVSTPKLLLPSICFKEDVFISGDLNLTLLDGSVIVIDYKNSPDNQRKLIGHVTLKDHPETILMFIEEHCLRFPLLQATNNRLSEQQILVLLESLKVLSSKNNTLTINALVVKVINFKESDLLKIFERIDLIKLPLCIKFEHVGFMQNEQLEVAINMHNFHVNQAIAKRLQFHSSCRLS